MFKRLLAVSTAALLTIASFAFAAELREDHPTRYVVQKGDTLWDISARFLKKPWLWPEIWQANPQVQNPHRIYPGDVLSLVYVDGQPRIAANTGGGSPQIRTGAAVETIPLADVEAILKQLTVLDEFRSLPHVIGIEEDRLLASAGQVVHVRGLANAQPGMSVQLARPVAEYRNGPTGPRAIGRGLNFRGDWVDYDWDAFGRHVGAKRRGDKAIGYELMRHAQGEVTQVQGEIAVVVIRQEGRDVRVGDRVLPVEAQPYDPYFYPQAPASVPDGAKVMAVADGIRFSGPKHVVALPVGAADGIKNGATFSIWRDGPRRGDTVRRRYASGAHNDQVTLPDDYVGRVMVFRTFNHMSYGLVMESIRPTRVGDLLKHPDATQ